MLEPFQHPDLSITQLIHPRGDKSRLIKYLSGIKTYDESKLMRSYEKDPIFLRFCIIDSVMRFLFYAYHLTSRPKKKATRRISQ